jgi:hypothetical protein
MFSLCFALDSFTRSIEMMARCSPLREVAAANVVEAKDMGEVGIMTKVVPTVGGDEMHVASSDEGHVSSVGGTDDSVDEKASNNKNKWTNNFGASTISLGHIKEMVEKRYFAKGEARVPGVEIVSESDEDEAIVYKNFFLLSAYACFRILLWRRFYLKFRHNSIY